MKHFDVDCSSGQRLFERLDLLCIIPVMIVAPLTIILVPEFARIWNQLWQIPKVFDIIKSCGLLAAPTLICLLFLVPSILVGTIAGLLIGRYCNRPILAAGLFSVISVTTALIIYRPSNQVVWEAMASMSAGQIVLPIPLSLLAMFFRTRRSHVNDVLYCSCGYSLRGNTSEICPECGSTFSWERIVQADAVPLLPWEQYSQGWVAFLQTMWLWIVYPRVFLRQLSDRNNLPLRFPRRFLCYALALLALVSLQIHIARAIIFAFQFATSWTEVSNTFLYWIKGGRYPEMAFLLYVCLVFIIIVSASTGSYLLVLTSPKRCAIMRRWSGLCIICIVLLPAFIIREERIPLWLYFSTGNRSAQESLIFLFFEDWLVPIYGGFAIATVGRVIGAMSVRRATMILFVAIATLYASSKILFDVLQTATGEGRLLFKTIL